MLVTKRRREWKTTGALKKLLCIVLHKMCPLLYGY